MDFVSDDLIRYKRQLLQRVTDIPLPPGTQLKDEGVQKWLIKDIFNDQVVSDLGAAYLRRQLNRAIAAMEKAITDPTEEEVSNDLYELRSRLGALAAEERQKEATAAQKKLVRYHPPTDLREPEQYIRIFEKAQVLGYGSDTGNRTWEASLRLMHFLSAHPQLIRGRTVLELGTGSGLLSIYCAAALGAKTVIATDISPQILQACQDNIELNASFWTDECRPPILRQLDLTNNLRVIIQTQLQDAEGNHVVPNIVLAADVIYDPEVARSLAQGLRMTVRSTSPGIEVIVAATVRNMELVEDFEQHFLVRLLEYERADQSWQLPVDFHEQKGLFHVVANEIRLYHRKPGAFCVG
ncbi:hypothetical protein DV736_g3135, partial [Chaetothyriales sp. CBS 134916]